MSFGPLPVNGCQTPAQPPVTGSITFLPDELTPICITITNRTGADKEIRVEREPGRDTTFTVKAIPGEITAQVKFYSVEPGTNITRIFCDDQLLAERTVQY